MLDLPKKTDHCLFYLNLYSIVFICAVFIFICQYSFSLNIAHTEPYRNRDTKTVIQTEPWVSWTAPPLIQINKIIYIYK